jgi:large subunit ribosomal protein L15
VKLHDLRPSEGAVKKRKRVGRGIAAGQGKTAGRGKLPFARGVGFRDPWRVRFTPVNLERLTVFKKGTEVTPEVLVEAGIIKRADELVTILGRGDVKHPLTVKAHRFSASARAKIEAAGGVVEELPWRRGGYRTR